MILSDSRNDLIISQYGIGVPNGEVAKTPEEAEAIAKKIGMHITR